MRGYIFIKQPMKTLLVISNYQVDYVSGAIGYPRALELEDKIIEAIKEYDDYIFTLEIQDDNYKNTIEGKYLITPHCLKNTSGALLYGKLESLRDKALKVFESNTFSCIDLAEYLKDKEYDEIDICGVNSHVNVASNALLIKSVLPNTKIKVKRELTTSYDLTLEEEAYDVLRANHIEVL